MKIDDSIVQKYLAGQEPQYYGDNWVFSAMGRGSLFIPPDPSHRQWVSKLCNKIKSQINNFKPCNYWLVKKLFPDFDDVVENYTIMLVVGFPDPYDALVLEHNGKECMVFDLIQFGEGKMDENYSCHKVLTHEIIHICLHNRYPEAENISYTDHLDYISFDEGFAHALTYPEDICSFEFTVSLQERFEKARTRLKLALLESNPNRQEKYSISADTGDYWDKFASISGKLYLLRNLTELQKIYEAGWREFSAKIVGIK